jgi:hypothetical protein
MFLTHRSLSNGLITLSTESGEAHSPTLTGLDWARRLNGGGCFSAGAAGVEQKQTKGTKGGQRKKWVRFFVTVSYAMRINRCGYRIIRDHKMGSFGKFCF